MSWGYCGTVCSTGASDVLPPLQTRTSCTLLPPPPLLPLHLLGHQLHKSSACVFTHTSTLIPKIWKYFALSLSLCLCDLYPGYEATSELFSLTWTQDYAFRQCVSFSTCSVPLWSTFAGSPWVYYVAPRVERGKRRKEGWDTWTTPTVRWLEPHPPYRSQ